MSASATRDGSAASGATRNPAAAAAAAARRLIIDTCISQRLFVPLAALVWLGEVALTALIINKVPYTEIDFSTYIQQADVFLKGERDYLKISGDSGPCVYPAGHLYIYALFHKLGGGQADIPTAQIAFGGLYLVNLAVVMALYQAAGAPTALLPFLALSKRLHSIYALRLFNDPIAMFFLYTSALLLCRRKWNAAVVIFSAALSIKMNILLFLPALATTLFRALGVPRSLLLAVAFFAVQGLLSLPFTLPSEQTRTHYLRQAFDLSRVFLYKWTVNWRMLPEHLFLHPTFARVLLLAHVGLLALFGLYRWTGLGALGLAWLRLRWSGPATAIAPAAVRGKTAEEKAKLEATFAPTSDYILSSLFTANLIGIICSRSLHYQFYSWYAHQIPFLLWRSRLNIGFKLVLPLTIELAWNTFPSTTFSSSLLLASHLVLLYGLWAAHAGDALEDEAAARARAHFRPPVLSAYASMSMSAADEGAQARVGWSSVSASASAPGRARTRKESDS